MSDWRDYDTHLIPQGTTCVTRFHASTDCVRVRNPDQTIDREEAYLTWHDPEPCQYCHDDVEKTTESDSNPQKIIGKLGGAD